MTNVTGTVFVSVQRLRDPRQAAFLAGVERLLQRWGLAWITLDQTEDASPDSLPEIREALLACQGALVIAYERWRTDVVAEYPDTPSAASREAHRLPTVWNQIEAAMAYQAGLPLLILTELGLHEQGMLSTHRGAVQVARFTLERGSSGLPDTATAAAVEEWCRDLMAHIGAWPR